MFKRFLELFSDEENTDLPHYDPIHIGAVLILVFVGISLLFWMLWSLLVFGGGIQSKIIPFILLVLRVKNLTDFGYIGNPYEMGIFDGWVTNIIALIFLLLTIVAIWYVMRKKPRQSMY